MYALRWLWTHWDLNPGPSACEADVIPLHHVPLEDASRSTQLSNRLLELEGRPARVITPSLCLQLFFRNMWKMPVRGLYSIKH